MTFNRTARLALSLTLLILRRSSLCSAVSERRRALSLFSGATTDDMDDPLELICTLNGDVRLVLL